jgi:hypothetical protein
MSKLASKESTMLSSTESRRTAFNPRVRGYHAVYHDGEVNHCPGCGRTHWLIGRMSAECAFCGTALPLKEAATHGPAPTPVFWSGQRPSYAELNAA